MRKRRKPYNKVDYLNYKERALKFVEQRIEYYNRIYRVKFNKITRMEYIDRRKRKIKYFVGETEGIVVRKTRKATGFYRLGDYDEQPRLEVDKWHILYEVAYKLTRLPVLVSPEDIDAYDVYGAFDDVAYAYMPEIK